MSLEKKSFATRRPGLAGWIAISSLLVLGSPLLAQTVPTTSAEANLRVTVRIYNYAQVETETLARAENRVVRIYRHVGIDMVWLEYPVGLMYAGSAQVTQPARRTWEIALRILPQSMAERFPSHHESLGAALPCSAGVPVCYVQVFYHHVEELARGGDVSADLSQILGHVIAHEIGHLLLGVGSHSRTGIMQALWGDGDLRSASRGILLFTPEQSDRIRAAVQVRLAVQNALAGRQPVQ